jgi:hypothetical protein
MILLINNVQQFNTRHLIKQYRLLRNWTKMLLLQKWIYIVQSAFRLLPVYPGDFNLLGFKIDSDFFIDNCMPMGCSIRCSTFEKCSTFLNWLTTKESHSENLDHYLDDFFFAGKANSNDCQSLMTAFVNICNKLRVPIADEKTEGRTCVMEYLGLTIDTREMTVKIPDKKMKKTTSSD